MRTCGSLSCCGRAAIPFSGVTVWYTGEDSMTKTTLPSKTSSSHGGIRGADFDRRSSQAEGRFGRMFRSLPAASWPEEALRDLAGDGQQSDRMSAPPEVDPANLRLPRAPSEMEQPTRLHDDEEDSAIDAGYTYLGQFIDHDISFDPASSLQQRNDVDALVDFRTPRLDLDSLYGSGPDDQPYLYADRGRKFQLGEVLIEGAGGRPIGRDLPRHTWTDHDGEHHRALIGDKRNDENVIVSQLHGVFLQFHNRLADDHPEWDFEEIQRRVRWHYQYVILHDFLYRIARRDVIEDILPHFKSGKSIYEDAPRLKFYKPRNDAFMPIEFSTAAYRFGHAMVRPVYRLNTKLAGGNKNDATNPNEITRGIDGRQFIFAGLKHRGLNGFDRFPREWGIDWNLFFDLTGDKASRTGPNRTQPSYKLDPSLVNPLAFLPEFSKISSTPPLDDIAKLQARPHPGAVANLALRNLMRGVSMGLPSGQDVALAMGLTPLTDSQLRVGKATNAADFKAAPSIADIGQGAFKGKAPLWYYLLAEGAADWYKKGGDQVTGLQLGEVGSRLVVETFVGMLMADGHSVLRQAPGWHPTLGKQAGFDMPDLVKYALGL
jgi:hypothetical protein